MLINEKVAYLKGIIDATNINTETKEGRMLIEIVNALELIAFDLNDHNEAIDELNDYVEELDGDLAEVEDVVFDDDCDCDCDCDDCDCDCDDCDCCCDLDEDDDETEG